MIIFVTLKGFVGNLSKEKKENYSPIVCKYLKSIYLCKRKQNVMITNLKEKFK